MSKLMKAPLAQEVAQAKTSQKIGTATPEQIGQFIKSEVKRAAVRVGQSNLDPDVLMILIEDLAHTLTSQYKDLTFEEVSIAFREGANNSEDGYISSRHMIQWLKAYSTNIRPLGFQRDQKLIEPTANPESVINTARTKWTRHKEGQHQSLLIRTLWAAHQPLSEQDNLPKADPLIIARLESVERGPKSGIDKIFERKHEREFTGTPKDVIEKAAQVARYFDAEGNRDTFEA